MADEKAIDKNSEPFWRSKTLDEMSLDEWESLCDGCGRCCLHKLEEADTGELSYTNVACRLLDLNSCYCTDYVNRTFRVPDCVELTIQSMKTVRWLPPTCAYRLVGEGKDLKWWHPLVSGDPDTVHQAGVSVRGRVVLEDEAIDLEDYITEWPAEDPTA
ncbi:MAG: YcgN family cysteine cluster protein [Proteobacteria bacterium]|nr:YcgN family cysteine cluster protein [Pseudomonadota bacterium]